MSLRTLRRSWVAALTVLALFLSDRPALAQNSSDGPVFLIVDLDGSFVLPSFPPPDEGSSVLVIRIGTIFAGTTTFDSRYVAEDLSGLDLSEFDLPDDFNTHQAVVIGSFQELGSGEIHAVNQTSPEDNDPVDAAEVAFFNASQALLDQLTDGAGQFLVEELIDVIDANQDGANATRGEIQDLIFPGVSQNAAEVLEMTCNSPCEAEGDLFPHGGDGPLFNFGFLLDPDADDPLEFNASLIIDIDVKPGNSQNNVNTKKKNGKVPLAILSSATFDATTEIDRTTIDVEGVAPQKKITVKDVDGDGTDDLLLHFDVGDLDDEGAFDDGKLVLTAEIDVGDDVGTIIGTDTVTTNS